MTFNILKSKTFYGGIAAVAGYLATLPVIDLKHVVLGLGGLLTVLGIRDAQTKPTP